MRNLSQGRAWSLFPLPFLSHMQTTQSWLQTPVFSSPHKISVLPLPGGEGQAVPVQTPKLQRQVKGSSAHMVCAVSTNAVMHWYKHLPGEPPKRILYLSGQSPVFDDSGDRKRFQAQKHPTEPRYVLTIDYLTSRDSGTYYCAYWFYQSITVFGSGTKLTVSDKGNSPPAHSEILQKNHGNQTTYVCLIEKFYPEVIRVTWTDEAHKEVTDNVVQGDPWKATKEGKYSISSWLTVSAANKDKNYHCKYEHESKEHSLQAQGTYYMLRIFILRIIRDLTFSLQ
uniref:Ig-like domain-containing protein n=1 Tax=Aquila chrysaetos chrysaetos TaxID=223781 RepID=A0A663E4Y3_AQUCH